MISSIVISQLIDESKSKGRGAALPLPCTVAQPRACPTRPATASRSGVSIHRAFALLPGGLGIPSQSEETEPPPVESACSGQRRGFASITITARRVRPPAGTLVWGTVGDSLCPRCRAEDTLLQADSAHLHQHRRPFACTEFPRNGSVLRLKVPEARAQLCAGHEYWVTHVDDKEDDFSPDTPPSEKGRLVFNSCVHLRVSRQCPNSICCLDKSLSVPVEGPQIAGPKVHRSVLSLNLSCSSHGLTADGADGIANREPMGRALKRELAPGNQHRWAPALQESHSKENPSPGRLHLGTGTCPWSGSPPLQNIDLADVGPEQVTVGKEDQACTGSPTNQLSIHIPGWSYTAVETKVFSGSSKEQQGTARVTLSAPPVEQPPIKPVLPDGDSPTSNGCQSSNLSELRGKRHPSFLRPRTALPGFLCPSQDACTALQEDSDQIERALSEGDYTCCDLVVKIKDCKKSEDPATPGPATAPFPGPPEGPEPPELLGDCSEPQQTPENPLTLQEALEVHKPRFISRSQERLKKLEHMVQQRKAQQKEQEQLGQKQSLLPVRANKKHFTVPHPLSDNLFKPKERCISEKEMHMRSKRIYNNLPEVKKKKEEQKKKVILQSNRLRAEVFKKQLLDQLLQRNAV